MLNQRQIRNHYYPTAAVAALYGTPESRCYIEEFHATYQYKVDANLTDDGEKVLPAKGTDAHWVMINGRYNKEWMQAVGTVREGITLKWLADNKLEITAGSFVEPQDADSKVYTYAEKNPATFDIIDRSGNVVVAATDTYPDDTYEDGGVPQTVPGANDSVIHIVYMHPQTGDVKMLMSQTFETTQAKASYTSIYYNPIVPASLAGYLEIGRVITAANSNNTSRKNLVQPAPRIVGGGASGGEVNPVIPFILPKGGNIDLDAELLTLDDNIPAFFTASSDLTATAADCYWIKDGVTTAGDITVKKGETLVAWTAGNSVYGVVLGADGGLRGEPVADEATLKALTASEFELRKVTATGKIYEFTTNPTADQEADTNNLEADDGTGFWIEVKPITVKRVTVAIDPADYTYEDGTTSQDIIVGGGSYRLKVAIPGDKMLDTIDPANPSVPITIVDAENGIFEIELPETGVYPGGQMPITVNVKDNPRNVEMFTGTFVNTSQITLPVNDQMELVTTDLFTKNPGTKLRVDINVPFRSYTVADKWSGFLNVKLYCRQNAGDGWIRVVDWGYQEQLKSVEHIGNVARSVVLDEPFVTDATTLQFMLLVVNDSGQDILINKSHGLGTPSSQFSATNRAYSHVAVQEFGALTVLDTQIEMLSESTITVANTTGILGTLENGQASVQRLKKVSSEVMVDLNNGYRLASVTSPAGSTIVDPGRGLIRINPQNDTETIQVTVAASTNDMDPIGQGHETRYFRLDGSYGNYGPSADYLDLSKATKRDQLYPDWMMNSKGNLMKAARLINPTNDEMGFVLNSQPYLGGLSFAFSFWFKLESTTFNANYILGRNAAGVNQQNLHIGFRDTTRFTLAFWGDDANWDITNYSAGGKTGLDALADTMRHYFVVFDANTKKSELIIDGTHLGYKQHNDTYQGKWDMIGGRAGAFNIKGWLAKVRCFVYYDGRDSLQDAQTLRDWDGAGPKYLD